MDTNLTTVRPPAARSLHDICEAARRGTCGPFCGALHGDECVVTSAPVSVPVTGDTPTQPVRGYHMARFARAQSRGLISAAEVAAVTGTEAGTVVNTHSSPGSAPQNGPQVPRRAAWQISWSERAAGGLAVAVRLVSKVPLLW